MGRQRHDVHISLGQVTATGSVADVAERAATMRAEWATRRHLGLQVDGDGQLRARTMLPSRYHAHPPLTGRLTDAGGDLRLTGTVVESHAEVIVPWIYALAAAYCAAMAIALAVNGHPSPGVWILGPAAVIVGWFGWAFARLRGRVFATDTKRVTEQTRAALTEAATRVGADGKTAGA